MSNPILDRAAESIAAMRAQPELAQLADPEQHAVSQALKIAPELDPATVGAAWIVLGNVLGQLAGQYPDAFTPATMVNLAQLAGQRLYCGTELPRKVHCSHVYGSGTGCKFVATAATWDLIDAQMQTHYATYHPTLTWVPRDEQQAYQNFAALDDFLASEGLPPAHPSLANRPDGA